MKHYSYVIEIFNLLHTCFYIYLCMDLAYIKSYWQQFH